MSHVYPMTNANMHYMLEAFRSCQLELEELEKSEEWYTSDSLDLVINSRLLLEQELGLIQEEEEEEDEQFHESKQETLELCFD